MTGPGGYRTPSNPAPVSGPGALSRRTDGGQRQWDLPDPKYGEGTDYRRQQEGAPLAKAPDLPPVGSVVPAGGGDGPPTGSAPLAVTPLTAPTARPGEPITSGVPIGPGPGPSHVGINAAPGSLSEALRPFFLADETGVLANVAATLAERGM